MTDTPKRTARLVMLIDAPQTVTKTTDHDVTWNCFWNCASYSPIPIIAGSMMFAVAIWMVPITNSTVRKGVR